MRPDRFANVREVKSFTDEDEVNELLESDKSWVILNAGPTPKGTQFLLGRLEGPEGVEKR